MDILSEHVGGNDATFSEEVGKITNQTSISTESSEFKFFDDISFGHGFSEEALENSSSSSKEYNKNIQTLLQDSATGLSTSSFQSMESGYGSNETYTMSDDIYLDGLDDDLIFPPDVGGVQCCEDLMNEFARPNPITKYRSSIIERDMTKLVLDNTDNEEKTKTISFEYAICYKPDEDNDTPLMISIIKTILNYATQLILNCPDEKYLNIQNNLGQSALHLATYLQQNQIVDLLIKNGANFELLDNKGKNIFHICSEIGNIEMVKLIIESIKSLYDKFDLSEVMNYRDKDGYSPFYLSVLNRHFELSKYLASFPTVETHIVDTKNGDTVLHEAVSVAKSDLEDLDFIKFLCYKCKILAYTRNYLGVTPIDIAERKRLRRIYSYLCNRK